uniref:Candidate secreted effector Minc00328 n=1 Tax=Meloidogyne incognita TaxID=6306 RepID=A0A343JGW7_MELIC|nr:candidate secreted effector Minc00328 [Meloidogyne incognita]ASX95027.1 candidate secreted effector Minc04572 [Meloidogyne incognita]
MRAFLISIISLTLIISFVIANTADKTQASDSATGNIEHGNKKEETAAEKRATIGEEKKIAADEASLPAAGISKENTGKLENKREESKIEGQGQQHQANAEETNEKKTEKRDEQRAKNAEEKQEGIERRSDERRSETKRGDAELEKGQNKENIETSKTEKHESKKRTTEERKNVGTEEKREDKREEAIAPEEKKEEIEKEKNVETPRKQQKRWAIRAVRALF